MIVAVAVLGILLLVWVSTRVIGSLRSALRSVFDVQENRGIIAGKIFDAKMVVVAGTLFLANTAITIVLEAAQTYGVELLGLSSPAGGRAGAPRAWRQRCGGGRERRQQPRTRRRSRRVP